MFCKIKTNCSKFLPLINFFLLIVSVILFLFPHILSIKVNNEESFISGLNILTKQGISFNLFNAECFFKFSPLLKITVVLNVIFSILGFLFFKFKKYIMSAINHMISSLSFFMLLFSLSSLKKNMINLNISNNKILMNILWPYLFGILFEFLNAILSIVRKGKEKLAESIFFCCVGMSMLIILSIILYVFVFGLPGIFKIGLLNFVFNKNWNPNFNEFGVLYLALSSLFSTLGVIFLATPFGVLSAIYLSELASKKTQMIVMPLIEVLSGIPSVIYGFFGMTIIVPQIKKTFSFIETHNSPPIVGDSLLAVILVLAMMVLPTIISTSYLSIKNVSKSFKIASLNLGATKIQTIFKVTLKSAKSGILSGITLAFGKAIGETMAVMMVAGNVVNFPSFLSSVRLLTTGIAIDMSYASGLFRQALFGIGLVLFVIIILMNLLFKKTIKTFK